MDVVTYCLGKGRVWGFSLLVLFVDGVCWSYFLVVLLFLFMAITYSLLLLVVS